MNYAQVKKMWHYRNEILIGYNAADGVNTDVSTDANITRDPNNYLPVRADWYNNIFIYIVVFAALLAIIVLLPKAIQTLKTTF